MSQLSLFYQNKFVPHFLTGLSQIQQTPCFFASRNFPSCRVIPGRIPGGGQGQAGTQIWREAASHSRRGLGRREAPSPQTEGGFGTGSTPRVSAPLYFTPRTSPTSPQPQPRPGFSPPPLPQHLPRCGPLPGPPRAQPQVSGSPQVPPPTRALPMLGPPPTGPTPPSNGIPVPGPAPAAPPPGHTALPAPDVVLAGGSPARHPLSVSPRSREWPPRYPGRQAWCPPLPLHSLTPSPFPL